MTQSLLQTEGVVPYNMCVLSGFPDRETPQIHDLLSIRRLVCERQYSVRCGRRQWYNVWPNSRDVLRSRQGSDDGRTAEVDIRFRPRKWNLAYTLQRVESRHHLTASPAIRPETIPPPEDWISVGAGNRRASQHNRHRERGRSTATIYAITSTVSGNGDQGADPNNLVAITDTLSATSPPIRRNLHASLRGRQSGSSARRLLHPGETQRS